MALASEPRRLTRRCAAAAFVLFATSSFAASFTVTPVRIYMKPQDRAVAVTITNESDEPVVLQADIYTWTQKPDGTDDTQLTEDLILSPPIIKLPAKARQVVRLARLQPPDASRQLTYRMILREIPEAGPPRQNIQVQIALALSLPVFITPPAAKREISCQARRAEAALDVSCENRGSAYAQVREIQARRGERELGRFEGGTYILPGARKVMPVKGAEPPPAGPMKLVVTYDDGASDSFDATVE
jgi:fimbrial chaperone protein